jgi:hypothetical protein
MIKPAMKKLPAGASNQFILRLASFKRRFVENVQRATKNNNARTDNRLLKDKTKLTIINKIKQIN